MAYPLTLEPTNAFLGSGKEFQLPARASFRQLVVNFYEESERRVMAKKKFTGGTSRVCGAP
jgi:hypothetical protein